MSLPHPDLVAAAGAFGAGAAFARERQRFEELLAAGVALELVDPPAYDDVPGRRGVEYHLDTDPACVEHRPPATWRERRRFERNRGKGCPTCVSPAPRVRDLDVELLGAVVVCDVCGDGLAVDELDAGGRLWHNDDGSHTFYLAVADE